MTDRKKRLAGRKEGKLDPAAFLKVADAFIDVANRKNQTVLATDLSMAFLFAASRYNAHVAKNVLEVEVHEDFVQDAVKSFTEMLRQNLADPEV
ncbi:MAG: DUF3144 domain-containing protein [Alphaproteobacteria bacterium]|nr:MAG: DUF3144 domain-containing protein [Alphaproteobacteria bacterium]